MPTKKTSSKKSPAKKTARKKKPSTSGKSIVNEFKKTGHLLKQNYEAASKSQQMKNVHKAVNKTLDAMVKEINALISSAKKKELDEKIKSNVKSGLKKINTDLGKTLKKWK